MRSYGKIRVAQDGAIARITLFNPERRNAIGPQMVNELLWALSDAAEDSAVRVVVITGEGKAFCAGGDFAQPGATSNARFKMKNANTARFAATG